MLCVKELDNSAPAKVYYADMWGSRDERYSTLSESDLQATAWTELQPASPYYLFVPQETDYSAEYETGWRITDIFQTSSIGIATARDKLTIHRTAEAVRETVTDFVSLSVDKAREKYGLLEDTQDWKVHLAQEDLRNNPDAELCINQIRYRPFDTRWTYYTGHSRGFHCRPRPANMPHLLRENLGLCVCRIVTSSVWQHTLVTDQITENGYVSGRVSESGHVFPLYLYPGSEALLNSTKRELNFKPDFLTAFSKSLGLPQTPVSGLPEGISPEEILAYIYAVLYSPTYRERYYEFLKYDFPRIPLPLNIDYFRQLASLGQRLIGYHLLQDVSRSGTQPTHRFEGDGDGIVGTPRYVDGNVWINDTQYFTDVPAAVWEYEIGAYQVCEKWLKDRRGEDLSHAEVRQYRSILVAVTETLRVMAEIDEVWTL